MRAALSLPAALVMCAGIASAAPAIAASHTSGRVAAVTVSRPVVSSNPVAYARALRSKNWVATPDGLMNKSCVRRLPAGARVNRGQIILASGARQSIGSCRFPRLVQPGSVPGNGIRPVTNGWWAESNWNPPTWLSSLSVEYAVPTAPSVNGATNFLFSSFEPTNDSSIIQPVLTFGPSAAGGGNFWYVTSWYVFGSSSVFGSDIRVSPKDTIVGTMRASGCSSTGGGCTWAISTKDQNTGGVSQITVESDPAYGSAEGGVLESDNATGCDMMPANGHGVFRDIALTTGASYQSATPSFNVVYPSPKQCSISETASTTGADILWKP